MSLARKFLVLGLGGSALTFSYLVVQAAYYWPTVEALML